MGKCLFSRLLIIFLISTMLSFSQGFHNPVSTFNKQRQELVERLKKDSYPHLIIVKKGPDYYKHIDWIYNEADIDSSKIIWARDLGSEKNENLVEYYSDRKIWLLDLGNSFEDLRLLSLS